LSCPDAIVTLGPRQWARFMVVPVVRQQYEVFQ